MTKFKAQNKSKIKKTNIKTALKARVLISGNEAIAQGVDYDFMNINNAPPKLALKASRTGKGNGRVYFITVHEYKQLCCKPDDMVVTVTVPHDSR